MTFCGKTFGGERGIIYFCIKFEDYGRGYDSFQEKNV